MPPEYRPEEYWTARLERDFSLRGVGHVSYSERYNAWLYRRKRDVLRGALAGIAPPVRALDVGSGVGWVVAELLEQVGAEVEGCDIAAVAVERLRRRFPRASFFQAALGAEPLPRAEASYGLVTVLDVAYHVVDDEGWLAGVADLARLLAPGGRLVVSDGLQDVDRTPQPHVRFRSRARWEAALDAAALDLVAVEPCFRWLSRERAQRGFAHLPDGARGAIEYGLERVAPRPAHQHVLVASKRQPGKG
jgi:SAM-dependent methyltransferase